MPRSAFVPLLFSSLLLACGSGSTEPQPQPGPQPVQGEDAFNSNSLGSYDNVALGQTGSWQIAGGVLTATGPADQNVRVRKEVAFLNGYVETVSSRADDGGLVLRFASEGQYYLLAFRDDSAPAPRGDLNLAVYRRVGPEFTEIARGDIDWPRGQSRTLRFEAVGGVLRVYVDGQLAGEVLDPMPLPAGRPGIRHYGLDETWVTSFETFRWKESLD